MCAVVQGVPSGLPSCGLLGFDLSMCGHMLLCLVLLRKVHGWLLSAATMDAACVVVMLLLVVLIVCFGW